MKDSPPEQDFEPPIRLRRYIGSDLIDIHKRKKKDKISHLFMVIFLKKKGLSGIPFGVEDRSRTDDLLNHNQAL